MALSSNTKTNILSEDPSQLVQSELDSVIRDLKEITLMLEQSRVELGKLTQRNASITTQLQQIQAQKGTVSREEA